MDFASPWALETQYNLNGNRTGSFHREGDDADSWHGLSPSQVTPKGVIIPTITSHMSASLRMWGALGSRNVHLLGAALLLGCCCHGARSSAGSSVCTHCVNI